MINTPTKHHLLASLLSDLKYSLTLQIVISYHVLAKKLPQDVNPKAVFACNELDLKEVKVYGFDYDYTLACYKPSLEHLLYNLGRQTLIEQYKVRYLQCFLKKCNYKK